MGAWGVGFDDNDDYFNTKDEIPDAVVAILIEHHGSAMKGYRGEPDHERLAQEIRGKLIVTAKMLQAVPDFAITTTDAAALRQIIADVTDAAKRGAQEWRDPAKYLDTVGSEMKEIEDWLDRLDSPVGFLGGRIDRIVGGMDREPTPPSAEPLDPSEEIVIDPGDFDDVDETR